MTSPRHRAEYARLQLRPDTDMLCLLQHNKLRICHKTGFIFRGHDSFLVASVKGAVVTNCFSSLWPRVMGPSSEDPESRRNTSNFSKPVTANILNK